jgi:ribose 5-phosphate isomerase
MDVDFGAIVDPAALAARMCRIPRVVEHGIFDDLDKLYLARAGGVERIGRVIRL